MRAGTLERRARFFGGWMSKPGLGLLLLGLLLFPHAAKAWWNDDWTYRKQITIDAGAKGAGLVEDAGRMPLLLRLHDGNFDFTNAKDDGSDLRFIADDDKTPLKFHIESYDGTLGIALVWVDVPTIRASAPTKIWLYFGNQSAPDAQDPHGTYDGDTALIYHFADRNAPPRDQTAYANNALTSAQTVSASQIGSGVRFDGKSAVVLPGSPSLAIPGGGFTWAAWVKPDAAQDAAMLFAKHDGGANFFIGLDQDVPYVSVSDGTTTQRSSPIDPIGAGTWHYVAVTASDHITIYVDGQPKTSLAATLPALGGTASVGADADMTGTVTGNGFVGELDELEISKIARSAGFIAGTFASEGQDEKLTAYGTDEQHASWFSGGYMGVILKSVTLDGWVVIGMLALMAVISWVVMVTKTLYVRRVARGNKSFLDAFAKAGVDFGRFDGSVAAKERQAVHVSPLYRIYRAAAAELGRRFEGMHEGSETRRLSPQAIATIRANLDGVTAREGQRLNASMVLLTIAISGGPFLGLLGTVVGVMITFAAIAASGDVNINAIAPGMAAALVATVAGLSVAIPALFGYNYLISQIKDATTDMHVFVDEFATRLAEAYHARPEPQNLAAE